jgi:hypothetical protein
MSLEKPSKPADEQPNPYLPSGPPPVVFEDFQGIHTQTPRAGVPDQKMFWCDGFMPLTSATCGLSTGSARRFTPLLAARRLSFLTSSRQPRLNFVWCF